MKRNITLFCLIFMVSANMLFAQNNQDNDKKSKHIGIFEYSTGSGTNDYAQNTICSKLTIINGYKFNPYLSLGIGVGLNKLNFNEATLIPAFTHLKLNFANKKASPYFSLGLGYNYALKNETFFITNGNSGIVKYKGGFLLSPSIGFNYKLFPELSIHIGFSYDAQWLKTESKRYDSFGGGGYSLEDNNRIEYLNFVMGISF